MSRDTGKMICVAEITGAHGVRGLVKLRCFGENPGILTECGPLFDRNGETRYTIVKASPHKNHFITELEGVRDRTEAEQLRGTKLYVERDKFPETANADEFYYADLEGLDAEFDDGAAAGMVIAVYNFGAGDLLEIRLAGKRKSVMIPFTKEIVTDVDIAGGKIVIAPSEWLDK